MLKKSKTYFFGFLAGIEVTALVRLHIAGRISESRRKSLSEK
jgi:hypothetical protein